MQIRLYEKGTRPPPASDGVVGDMSCEALPAPGDVVQLEGRNAEVGRPLPGDRAAVPGGDDRRIDRARRRGRADRLSAQRLAEWNSRPRSVTSTSARPSSPPTAKPASSGVTLPSKARPIQ